MGYPRKPLRASAPAKQPVRRESVSADASASRVENAAAAYEACSAAFDSGSSNCSGGDGGGSSSGGSCD